LESKGQKVTDYCFICYVGWWVEYFEARTGKFGGF
jgi:hypothetical protein